MKSLQKNNMVDKEKGKDLERRMAGVEEYLTREGTTSLSSFTSPLAEEIKRRKEYDVRQNAEAEARNKGHLELLARRRREKPSNWPIIGTTIVCLGAIIATLHYVFGIFEPTYEPLKKEEPSKPRKHVTAPLNPGEQSEIEKVLGKVREQVNAIDGTNKERLNGIISQPGNNAERYYNAATVMFLIGEHYRSSEDQRKAYGTASAYLQEALKRNPNIDQTGLRERIRQGINTHNFLDTHEGKKE